MSDIAACEASIVMPCLNEADTLASCITKALRTLRDHRINGEIIVADNGSTDGSRAIAEAHGVRVVDVAEKGYGQALMGGIAAARGQFVIMGDADDSYDFAEIPRFIEKLRDGADLVQGCRLPSGGGRVLPGAMPVLHRWWGNPMFSLLARFWFWSSVNDVHCGLRGFRKDFYERLGQRCGGMDFATEMIIRASLDSGARIVEVPITLYPDGRRAHPPHLKTFRDGWRHLRLYLLFSPRWLFLYPGLLLMLLGTIGFGVAMPGLTIGGVTFDVHTMLFASLFLLMGYQSALFSVLAKAIAVAERRLPPDPRLTRLFTVATVERALILGGLVMSAGALLLLGAVNQWRLADFGHLDYSITMRWVIPGATAMALGFQTVLSAFLGCLLPRQ